MLAGRVSNYSGKGKFSSTDSCLVLSRFLQANGPWRIDQMKSRAHCLYFSVSDDGTPFAAGFQGGHIRVYNVDSGWKLQKDILTKNMRWTITDTCLSPDWRHLVYASTPPIVHIVDVGSSTTESLANVTFMWL
ncbi:LEC14B homolog isoform X2 [Mercurialis annua]|uniref:LEC14B homolog isoform X2 n=1 Tax=Mercurialis annua TaxID=3986 RepID=UPI00215F911E|nr:LEC14B homolog isoform X2 [Mercurialis annua]